MLALDKLQSGPLPCPDCAANLEQGVRPRRSKLWAYSQDEIWEYMLQPICGLQRAIVLDPYPWDQCVPWWNNRVGWIPNCEDAAHPPPPPNSGTLFHNMSCASYALRAYSTRGSPCVPGATPIRSARPDVVRVVEPFFKFVQNA